MNSRIGLPLGLLCILTVNCFAAPVSHTSQSSQFINVSQEIKPDDRQKYHNSFWFEVGAKCKLNTYQQTAHLKLELKSGYAVINGKHYKSPSVLDNFEVNDNDKFSVQVGKYSKVAVTLLQEGNTKKIKADCSVSV